MTSHFGVFRLAGQTQLVHEMQFVHEQIAARESDPQQGPKDISMCLGSGELGRTARLHEPKIKGVSGGKTSGALLLVLFNATAFTSYGKEQSFNAPVGISTVFKYATALNHLLNLPNRRVHLGDATVVYWADHKTVLEDAFAHLFSGAAAEEPKVEEDRERLREAKLLLSQMRGGTRNASIDPDDLDTHFFILGLSPNASRLSVRIWVEAKAAEMERRLGQHVQDFALKGGRDDLPPPVWRIVAATGRAEKDPEGTIEKLRYRLGFTAARGRSRPLHPYGRAVSAIAPYHDGAAHSERRRCKFRSRQRNQSVPGTKLAPARRFFGGTNGT